VLTYANITPPFPLIADESVILVSDIPILKNEFSFSKYTNPPLCYAFVLLISELVLMYM